MIRNMDAQLLLSLLTLIFSEIYQRTLVVDHVSNGRNLLFALLIIDNKDKGLSLCFVNIQRVTKALIFNCFYCVHQRVHLFILLLVVRFCCVLSVSVASINASTSSAVHLKHDFCVKTLLLKYQRFGRGGGGGGKPEFCLAEMQFFYYGGGIVESNLEQTGLQVWLLPFPTPKLQF